MSPLRLSPPAEEVLALLLKEYGQDRQRWPLWTYERRQDLLADGDASWLGQPWVERIRWSGLLPLMDVCRALDNAVKGAGGQLRTFKPHQPLVGWLKPLDDGVDLELRSARREPGHAKLPVSTLVPVALRMRTAALFALTAHPVPPSQVSDIPVPRGWSLVRLPLDDKDRSDLGASVIHAMSRLGQLGDSPEGSPQLSLFLRCLDYEATSGQRRTSRKSRAKLRRSLERELSRRMGLLPDRTGGRRVILEKGMLRQLLTEAREIVSEVREWKPSEGLLDRLAEADDQVGADLDDELKDDLEWARWRASGSPQRPELRGDLARVLRFPFLTWKEIASAMDGSVEKRIALEWVRRRLASNVAAKTLENLAAGATD